MRRRYTPLTKTGLGECGENRPTASRRVQLDLHRVGGRAPRRERREDGGVVLGAGRVARPRRPALQLELAVCRRPHQHVLAQTVEGVREAVECDDMRVAEHPSWSDSDALRWKLRFFWGGGGSRSVTLCKFITLHYSLWCDIPAIICGKCINSLTNWIMHLFMPIILWVAVCKPRVIWRWWTFSIILNYCIMFYLWVAPVLAAACSLNRSLFVTKLMSAVDDIFRLHF